MKFKLAFKKYSQLILISILLLGLFSCKQKVKESTESQFKYDSFSKNLMDVGVTSQEFIEKLTYSEQLYQEGLAHDPYQYRDYKKDINISAANIGVYLTDAQYLKAYGKVQEAFLSSKSAQHLFRLVETGTIDTSIAQIQEGYRKRDSAWFYLNDALKDTVNGLSELERKQYLISLSYGLFIERNYILLNLLNKHTDFEEAKVSALFNFLKKHNDQLSYILELRASYASGEYHHYLKTDLNDYHVYYKENIELFDMESNTFRQKEFTLNLLDRVSQMRNYIVYDGLLIKVKSNE